MQISFISIDGNPSGKWDIIEKTCSPIRPETETPFAKRMIQENFPDYKTAEVAAKQFAASAKLAYYPPEFRAVSYLPAPNQGCVPLLILPEKIIARAVYAPNNSLIENVSIPMNDAFVVGARLSQHYGAPIISINAQAVPQSNL